MYHVTDTHPGDGVNFNVYVPTFLCTSLNVGEDKYGGEKPAEDKEPDRLLQTSRTEVRHNTIRL